MARHKMLGSTLRRARMEAGMTQVDVARESGASRQYVVKVEAGQILPRRPFLAKIAPVIGMGDRVDYLMGLGAMDQALRVLQGWRAVTFERVCYRLADPSDELWVVLAGLVENSDGK